MRAGQVELHELNGTVRDHLPDDHGLFHDQDSYALHMVTSHLPLMSCLVPTGRLWQSGSERDDDGVVRLGGAGRGRPPSVRVHRLRAGQGSSGNQEAPQGSLQETQPVPRPLHTQVRSF